MRRVSPERSLLLLSTTSKIGGTERIVLGLAQGLRSLRVDVSTVLAEDVDAEKTVDWFREHGVWANTSPAVLTVYQRHTPRALLDLRRLVQQNGAQAANIHYGGNHLSLKDVLAIRAAGVKRCIVSIHHANPIVEPRQRTMTRLGAQLASAVVVTTDVAKDVMLDAGVPERKIHVIPPCAEPPSEMTSRAEARARLGLEPDDFVICALARLTREKGIADLIEGAARTRDSNVPIQLVIAGEGPAREELEALAASRLPGRVRFTGRVPETGAIYAAADIFALPSHMEGFGLVYLEAALYGVPSIATLVGGIPIAIDDGVTGTLVSVGDVDAIASAIETLRDDPELRRRMGEAARLRTERDFSPAAMCQKYANLLFD